MPLTGLGFVPSVVKRISWRPDPPSVAERLTETVPVFQPAEQAPPLQAIELTGAVPSAVTVNEPGLEVSPALFVAVVLFGSAGSTAAFVKL